MLPDSQIHLVPLTVAAITALVGAGLILATARQWPDRVEGMRGWGRSSGGSLCFAGGSLCGSVLIGHGIWIVVVGVVGLGLVVWHQTVAAPTRRGWSAMNALPAVYLLCVVTLVPVVSKVARDWRILHPLEGLPEIGVDALERSPELPAARLSRAECNSQHDVTWFTGSGDNEVLHWLTPVVDPDWTPHQPVGVWAYSDNQGCYRSVDRVIRIGRLETKQRRRLRGEAVPLANAITVRVADPDQEYRSRMRLALWAHGALCAAVLGVCLPIDRESRVWRRDPPGADRHRRRCRLPATGPAAADQPSRADASRRSQRTTPHLVDPDARHSRLRDAPRPLPDQVAPRVVGARHRRAQRHPSHPPLRSDRARSRHRRRDPPGERGSETCRGDGGRGGGAPAAPVLDGAVERWVAACFPNASGDGLGFRSCPTSSHSQRSKRRPQGSEDRQSQAGSAHSKRSTQAPSPASPPTQT